MQQLLDKWERLRTSEYLRPDEKLMLNHCISDLQRFMDHDVVEKSDKQQTAVEWLIEQLRNNENIRWRGTRLIELAEQAKAMHKQEIINAFEVGTDCVYDLNVPQSAQDYYNETYGGNKMKLYTEEEIIRAIELSDGRSIDEVLAGLKSIELPSDEEIIDRALEVGYTNTLFSDGAKWMRDKIQGGNK